MSNRGTDSFNEEQSAKAVANHLDQPHQEALRTYNDALFENQRIGKQARRFHATDRGLDDRHPFGLPRIDGNRGPDQSAYEACSH